jgi:hypothetical protein
MMDDSATNNKRYSHQSRVKRTGHPRNEGSSNDEEGGASSNDGSGDGSPHSLLSLGASSAGSSPLSQSSAGRRRARATQSRIKRYGGPTTSSKDDEIPGVTPTMSGDSFSHDASSGGWSTGNEDSEDGSRHSGDQHHHHHHHHHHPGLSPKNPQEDNNESHINYLSLAAGGGSGNDDSMIDLDRSLSMEDDESYYSSTTDDSEEAYLKETTKKYDKYKDLLNNNDLPAKSPWKNKSSRKLGAPPSLELSPGDSRRTLDTTGLFGGASQISAKASDIGYDPTSLEEEKKAKRARHNVPIPDSNILDKEDMKTLKMMLSVGDSDSSENSSGETGSPRSHGMMSFSSQENDKPFVDDDNSSDGDLVKSDDNDEGDVSYFSASQAPRSTANGSKYSQEDLSYQDQSSKDDEDSKSQRSFIFDQPDSEEGSLIDELVIDNDVLLEESRGAGVEKEDEDEEEAENDNMRKAAAMLAMGGAAAGVAVGLNALADSSTSNNDGDGVHRMVELHHVEPQEKPVTAPTPPVASTVHLRHVEPKERSIEHVEPKLNEDVHLRHVERKSMMSEDPVELDSLPKSEPQDERVSSLGRDPPTELKSIALSNPEKPDESSSEFMESEIIRHQPQETRMSRYTAGVASRKPNTSYNFDDDDDDDDLDDDFGGGDESFSDIWEQSVTAEAKSHAPAMPIARAQSASEEKEEDRPNRVYATRADGSIIERAPSGRWANTDKKADEEKRTEDDLEEDLDAYFSGLKRDSTVRGKKIAAAVAAGTSGAALASVEKSKKAPTIDENSELSMGEGSINAFDFGNPSERDGSEMDSYSLGASKDIEALAVAPKIDKKEYNPRREDDSDTSMSFEEVSGALAAMDDSKKESSSEANSAGPRKPQKPSKDVKKKSSKNQKPGPTPKIPPFWSGVRRNFIRGVLLLVLIAAIVVPIYFFVIDTDDSEDVGVQDDVPKLQIFDPIDTPSPTDPPMPTSPPTLRPTRVPTPNNGIPIPPSQIAPVTPPTPETGAPSSDPTSAPTLSPVLVPTGSVTDSPTTVPTQSVTATPSKSPDLSPLDIVRSILTTAAPELESAFDDISSIPFAALQWLADDPAVLSYPEPKVIQRFSLASFFLSTNGDAWTRSDNWFTYSDECDWYTTSTGDLSCNEAGGYINLELELNNIGGTLPDQLYLLSNLQRLDLTRNGSPNFISGAVPDMYGSFSSLRHFSLAGNQLTGELPSTLGQLSSLQLLNFKDNSISGSIPDSIGFLSELTTLDLTSNQFTGILPTSFGRLTKMKNLLLAENRISGPIPSDLGRMFLLENIHLEGNQLSILPSELGNLIFLRSMSIARNVMQGPLPEQLGNLVNILNLDLSENELSGVIPSAFGGLVLIRGKSQNTTRLSCLSDSKANINIISLLLTALSTQTTWICQTMFLLGRYLRNLDGSFS